MDIMSFLAPFWSNWLVVALMTSMLNALVNLLDVYFVQRVYVDEYDGIVISAVFQMIIWIAAPFLGIGSISVIIAIYAMIAGTLFVLSTIFYFKAMCLKCDVVIIESIWGLVLVIVPILSWITIGTRLNPIQYVGIVVAFLGAIIPSLNHKINNNFWKIFKLMMGAVFFLALCMIMEKKVYEETNFFSGYLFFSLGAGLTGLIFLKIRKIRTGRKIRSILSLSKKNWVVFLLAESMAFLAVTFANRAVDLAADPSLVAVVDCSQEIFIMVFSLMAIISKGNSNLDYVDYFVIQTEGWIFKISSFFLIITGVYLVS